MAKTLYEFCLERDEFDLLVQWDKEKNGDLTPRTVTSGSHRKIWWKCFQGHSWQAVVYTRTNQHSGCPYCAGRMLSPMSCRLAEEAPRLVKEWHPSKNVGLLPNDVSPGSHKRVWWKCEKGHEWIAQVKSRVQGANCPVCTNRKILKGFNDLATTHPKLADQWHKQKNGPLTPEGVGGGSHRKVWWQCEKGHEWEATILSRTSVGCGCPICAGKVVVPGVNDLGSQNPRVAAQWHPDKNGEMTPRDVTPYSNRSVWWQCEKGHEYRSIIGRRVQSDTGCPYCTNRKVLAGFNDLATLEPVIAAQWQEELNGELTPQMVTVGSSKKVWWQCDEGHVWRAVIYSRTGSGRYGCPVCAGKVKEPKQIRYGEMIAERKGSGA